jgi:hypothetical protein
MSVSRNVISLPSYISISDEDIEIEDVVKTMYPSVTKIKKISRRFLIKGEISWHKIGHWQMISKKKKIIF